jgi:EAL domain-containing protein (putative c-di-GMP-specific phosphodiesterase class I)
VNLSGRQFRQQALAATIRDALTEFGITAAALGVEITESSIMHNDNLTKSILIELDRMGVHLSLDDFGTGYSSLSYLKSFPIGVLKIDRSFVRDVTTDSDDAAIATAIIAMAHSLKMGVIAEGVETMEQLEFLRRQGCDAVQGYLIGRPVPAAEFAKLLHGGNLIRAADAR